MNIKTFWHNHSHQIKPAFKFVHKCVGAAAELRERPRVLDFIHLGFSLKEDFDESFNLNDPYTYFNNPGWKFLSSGFLGEKVVELLMSSPKHHVVPVASNSESISSYSCMVDGVKFGWVVFDDTVDKLYVEKTGYDTAYSVLSNLFWELHSLNVTLGFNETEEKLYLKDDFGDVSYFNSPKIDEYVDDISAYMREEIHRSMLFYGPPGTGKSNIVKGITTRLGMKTIRINNLPALSGDNIGEVLRIFNPDAVILEDVDSLNINDLSSFLAQLEEFNKKLKLIFATANQVGLLEDAMLRPGRFDQAIFINKLDKVVVMEMVGGDKELFELVSDFPAAYISEVLKRIKVKGRAAGIASIEDLRIRLEKQEKTSYEINNDEYS